MEIKIIGKMDHTIDNTHESANRVYSQYGLCPTISTCAGGNIQPKILEGEENMIEKAKCLGGLSDDKWGKQYHQQDRVYSSDGLAMCHPATIQDGSYKYVVEEKQIVAMRGRNPENPKSRKSGLPTEQRLEPNKNGTTNALTTVQKDDLVLEKPRYRIRKLTPRECWRLMGFSDTDFDKAEKVCSNTQLYKQAGNSIVVNVLMGIFSQML
jgi:DNA (cytosine-5)-methyltransferase 1